MHHRVSVEFDRQNQRKEISCLNKSIYVFNEASRGETARNHLPPKWRRCTPSSTPGKRSSRNNIVDMGGKLGSGKVVTSEGATDGPFVEAKEVVGGYMIVSAESLEEAMEVARECPGLVMPGLRR